MDSSRSFALSDAILIYINRIIHMIAYSFNFCSGCCQVGHKKHDWLFSSLRTYFSLVLKPLSYYISCPFKTQKRKRHEKNRRTKPTKSPSPSLPTHQGAIVWANQSRMTSTTLSETIMTWWWGRHTVKPPNTTTHPNGRKDGILAQIPQTFFGAHELFRL